MKKLFIVLGIKKLVFIKFATHFCIFSKLNFYVIQFSFDQLPFESKHILRFLGLALV